MKALKQLALLAGTDMHSAAAAACEVLPRGNGVEATGAHVPRSDRETKPIPVMRLLPPALMLCLFLAPSTAFAKDVKAANKSKPVQALELDFKGSFDLRNGGGALGKEHKGGWAKSPGESRRNIKTEASVAKARRVKIVTAKPEQAKASNAYQQAFESLRLRAAAIAPTESGRAEVSFIVGKKGQPERAFVRGLSPLVDKALQKHLATLRFPKEHSGQFYSSKINIAASAKPVALSKSKMARKRKARGRK